MKLTGLVLLLSLVAGSAMFDPNAMKCENMKRKIRKPACKKDQETGEATDAEACCKLLNANQDLKEMCDACAAGKKWTTELCNKCHEDEQQEDAAAAAVPAAASAAPAAKSSTGNCNQLDRPQCSEKPDKKKLKSDLMTNSNCTSVAGGLQIETYYFQEAGEVVYCKNMADGTCDCTPAGGLNKIPGESSKEDCEEMTSGFQDDTEKLNKLSYCQREGVKMVKANKSRKMMKMILKSTFTGKGDAAVDCAHFLNTPEGEEYFAEKQAGGELSPEQKAKMKAAAEAKKAKEAEEGASKGKGGGGGGNVVEELKKAQEKRKRRAEKKAAAAAAKNKQAQGQEVL